MTISNNQIQANDNGIDMNSDFTICTLNIFNNTIATDGGQGINLQPKSQASLPCSFKETWYPETEVWRLGSNRET